MTRTVKVRLELDREDFKRGLREGASDVRGFDGEVRTAGRDVSAMGVEAKSAGAEVRGLGDDAKRSSRDVDGLGTSTRNTRQNIVDLTRDIDKTKTALAGLGAEFRRTGQVNVDELKKLSNSLRDLERAKDLIGKLAPGDGGKKKSGGGLLDFALDEWIAKLARGTAAGIGAGIEAAGQLAKDHKIAAAIIGAIVVSAPAIGAAVNAAMLLGVGGGALAVGIVGAFQNPVIPEAFKHLFQDALAGLGAASGPLVEPLLRGVTKFGEALNKLMPAIAAGMSKLAPVIDHLVDGLIGFIDKIGPGFAAAFAAAIPLLDQVAADLPLLGQGIGSFLDAMAAGGPGAVAFFHDLIVLINLTLTYVGGLVLALSTVYNVFSALSRVMSGDLAGAVQIWEQFGKKSKEAGKDGEDGFKGLADALKGAGDEASIADQKLQPLKQTLQELQGLMLSADQAAGQWRQGLLGLADSVKQHGTSLQQNTANGEANIATLQGMVDKARSVREANIANGQSVAYADEQYQANIQTLIDSAAKLGYNREQVEALIGKYRQVPGNVQTNVLLLGAIDAISKGQTLAELLRSLDGKVSRSQVITTYISQRDEQSGYSAGPRKGVVTYQRWGGVTEHADTGLLRDASIHSAASPARYAFAEPSTQGEAFIPRSGNLERSRSIWSYVGQNWLGMGPAGSGGGGGGSMRITITAAPGGTMVDQAMSSWFMSAIRQGQITLTTDQGSRVRVG